MSKIKEEAQDSPLIKPGKPGSLTFKQWASKHIHSLFWGDAASFEKLVQQYQNPANTSANTDNFSFFSSTFLMVYGIDGYEPTTHMITPAHRHSAGELQEAYEYKGEALSPWLMLASFIGLPTRTGCSESASPPSSPSYKKLIETDTQLTEDETTPTVALSKMPKLTGWGILKNMIGGWDTLPDEDKYQEKKIWQWVVLFPVKLPIIFPIKFISIFFKLPLHIIKTFTELFPSLANYGLHIAMAKIYAKIAALDEPNNTDDEWKIPKILALSILSLCLALLHMSFKVLTIIGRALFSPDKSSKLASAYGREVNKKLGFLVYYLNKLITGLFWATAIPLALGAAIIYFPNVVVPIITWFGNLPPVAIALHAMNGALVSFTTEFFAYDITPTVAALATLLHIPVPETIALIGATLGFFGSTIIVIIMTWFATPFSDKWAAWHEGGPFTTWLPSKWNAITTYLSALFYGPAPKNETELKIFTAVEPEGSVTGPSNTATAHVDDKAKFHGAAKDGSTSADRMSARVEEGRRRSEPPLDQSQTVSGKSSSITDNNEPIVCDFK